MCARLNSVPLLATAQLGAFLKSAHDEKPLPSNAFIGNKSFSLLYYLKSYGLN